MHFKLRPSSSSGTNLTSQITVPYPGTDTNNQGLRVLAIDHLIPDSPENPPILYY